MDKLNLKDTGTDDPYGDEFLWDDVNMRTLTLRLDSSDANGDNTVVCVHCKIAFKHMFVPDCSCPNNSTEVATCFACVYAECTTAPPHPGNKLEEYKINRQYNENRTIECCKCKQKYNKVRAFGLDVPKLLPVAYKFLFRRDVTKLNQTKYDQALNVFNLSVGPFLIVLRFLIKCMDVIYSNYNERLHGRKYGDAMACLALAFNNGNARTLKITIDSHIHHVPVHHLLVGGESLNNKSILKMVKEIRVMTNPMNRLSNLAIFDGNIESSDYSDRGLTVLQALIARVGHLQTSEEENNAEENSEENMKPRLIDSEAYRYKLFELLFQLSNRVEENIPKWATDAAETIPMEVGFGLGIFVEKGCGTF